MKWAGLAVIASVVAATAASAQDVYYDTEVWDDPDDEAAIVEEEYVVRERVIERSEPATEDGIVVAPRVYGWSYEMRPEDCGTFRYWNGEYCADARFDPPETD
jgi:hypothetical protein